MWARDLLPQVLDCKENHSGYCSYNGAHMHGRYSTFGYQAKVLDPDNVPVSIMDSARELLNAISLLRPKVIVQDGYLYAYAKYCPKEKQVHERPLFFVCHSLGGLIVCQVRLALEHGYLSQLIIAGSITCTTERGARIA